MLMPISNNRCIYHIKAYHHKKAHVSGAGNNHQLQNKFHIAQQTALNKNIVPLQT